jgi:hypothetical protein
MGEKVDAADLGHTYYGDNVYGTRRDGGLMSFMLAQRSNGDM